MSPPPGGGRVQTSLLAALALVLGPGAAALHESGLMSLGPPGTLWPVAFVALGGAAGLLAGIALTRHASRALGLLVALPNALVLALYGFLLAFFGLGGSR